MVETKSTEWPKSYYAEKDGKKRKTLLDQAMQDNPEDIANQCRTILWESRYLIKGEVPKQPADLYLGIWMDLVYLAHKKAGIFGNKGTAKELKKCIERLGMDRILQYGEAGEEVLYQEFYHLCMFYYNICSTDRSYGTKFMGLIPMKGDDVIIKLADEVAKVAYRLPISVNMQKDLKFFTRAATQAFYDSFPDDVNRLDALVESNINE